MENQSSPPTEAQNIRMSSESSEFKNNNEIPDLKHQSVPEENNPRYENLLDIGEGEVNFLPTASSSFMQLKHELTRYKKLAEDREIALVTEQSKTKEVYSKLDAALALNKKYEEELKVYQNKTASSLFSSSSDNENIASVISFFEKAMNNLSESLNPIAEQRNELLKLCSSYQQYLDIADKEIERLQNELNNEVEKNENNSKEIEELYEELAEIVPDYCQDENEQSTPREKIVALVQNLADQSSSYSTVVSEKDGDQGQILGHLENALYFIRTLKTAKSDAENPVKDQELRNLIDDQCEKIEEFLKEHKPDAVTSIFSDSNMEEQLKTFYQLVDENDKNESPIRELYALFTAAVEVNKMLFERNNDLDEEFQNIRTQAQEIQDLLNEQNNESEKKDYILEELLDKMEKTLEQRPENVISGYEDVCSIIDELMSEMSKKDKEMKTLKQKCDKLQKFEDTYSSQTQTKDKQIAELVNKLNETKYNAEVKQNELQTRLEEAHGYMVEHGHDHELLEKANHRIEKLKQRVHDYEEIQAQLRDSQEQNLVLKNEVSRMTRQVEMYQQSEELTASTLSGYENRVSSMKGKLGQLKKKNEELEEKIRTSIEDMKKQNESLEETYKKTVQQMNDENDDLRAKLAEEKEANKQGKKSLDEYQSKIAKMKLDELQRTTELNETKNSLKISEQQLNAKLEAQKIVYTTQIEKEKAHCAECAKRLSIIIGEKKSASTDIDEVIGRVEVKYNTRHMNDAYKTRELLKLKDEDSLYKIISKLTKVLYQKEGKVKDLEENQKELEKNLEQANQIAASTTAEQLAMWKKWANKLYRRLNNGEMNPINPEKTRESIEKAIDNLVKPQIVERKFTILQKQKNIYQANDKKAMKEKGKKPIDSIRAVTLSFMFLGRLQKFSQNVPLPYKMNSKRSEK